MLVLNGFYIKIGRSLAQNARRVARVARVAQSRVAESRVAESG